MPLLIAVTGATGYLGRFIVDEIVRQGGSVRALCRPDSDKDGFAGSIEWVEGDLRSGESLKRLVTGCDAVVHLAYEHVEGRYRGGEGEDLDAWLDANLMGSLHLLQHAALAQVPRFVFLSSRAVFSSTDPGRVLDETHPVSPDTHYGAYKASIEAFLDSFRTQTNIQTFAVRATGVYGLTRPVEKTKWWDVVNRALREEDIGPMRGGTEVFGGDVARAVWALLTEPDLAFNVVHLSDLFVTNEMVAGIAKRYAGLAHPARPAPPTFATNPLECKNANRLGIQFGGLGVLESEIHHLVDAIMASREPVEMG